MYVGLDLSLTSTGMCRLWDSAIFETRAVGSNDLRGVERLTHIFDGVKAFFDEMTSQGEAIDMVAIEGYAYGTPGGKGFDRAELAGLVKHWLHVNNYPFIIVVPTTLKVFVTGNGEADKVMMCEVIKAQYGVDFEADWKGRHHETKPKPRPEGWGSLKTHWRTDEADAFGLANVAAFYNGDWDRQPTYRQVESIELIKGDPQGTLTADNKRRKDNSIGRRPGSTKVGRRKKNQEPVNA